MSYPSYLLTSSADWAMKKPMVLAGILEPRGLMEILASPPSSGLTSSASSSSLSLTKQSSEAWAKVIPVKVGDSVSVYISHPVPGEEAAVMTSQYLTHLWYEECMWLD